MSNAEWTFLLSGFVFGMIVGGSTVVAAVELQERRWRKEEVARKFLRGVHREPMPVVKAEANGIATMPNTVGVYRVIFTDVQVPWCDACSNLEAHIHCSGCGSIEHAVADCDMKG